MQVFKETDRNNYFDKNLKKNDECNSMRHKRVQRLQWLHDKNKGNDKNNNFDDNSKKCWEQFGNEGVQRPKQKMMKAIILSKITKTCRVQWHHAREGPKTPTKMMKMTILPKMTKTSWEQWHATGQLRGSKDPNKNDECNDFDKNYKKSG